MQIKVLKLKDFRNYSSLEVQFSPGLNILTGSNGSGKTNIVEAINFLTIGKSFRTQDESESIQFNKEFAVDEIKFEKQGKEHDIKAIISKQGKKIYFNEIELKKLSELSGKLLNVLFTPRDVLLFANQPMERRKLLDIHLSSMYPEYLMNLSLYRNLLKRRNLALKEEKIDRLYIEVLNEKMVEPQFIISTYRRNFIQELNKYVSQTYERLDGKKNLIELKYEGISSYQNQKEFTNELISFYKDDFETDVRRKLTSRGIHHDDFETFLNGREIDLFGSQGQNRMASLSLKISLYELIKNRIQEKPIVILDDVLSELDENHQKRLLETIKDFDQVFITCTKDKFDIQKCSTYEINNNLVTRR